MNWLRILLFVLIGLSGLTAFGYLFLILPRLHKADAAPVKGLLFAHRGFHADGTDCPQNTLPAFAKAAEYGYGMELDVHFTKDRQLAVIHDHSLQALCGYDGTVEKMTLAELKKLHIGNTREQIPTLEEVLSLVNGRTPLLIELKGSDNGKDFCPRLMEALDRYKGLYCIESFNPLHLRWLKKHRPEILRGQLACPMDWQHKKTVSEKAKAFAAEMLLGNILSRPDFIAYDYRYPRKLSVRLCRHFGAYMAGWTVRTPEAYAESREAFPIQIFEGFRPEKE